MVAATRFIRKADRIAKAKADALRQAVFDFGLPEQAETDILVTVARYENGGILPAWKFNMISPEQCLAVWEGIRKMDRPELTRRVFDYALTHIEPNSGAITLTREELAERCETEPRNISTIMTQLEAHKIIFRHRLKVAGMRGRGPVRYFLNPNIAWNGKLEVRSEEAKQLPLPFMVIEGGKP